MVDLTFIGICKNCENADLELEHLEFNNSMDTCNVWTVKCIHEKACLAIWRRKLKSKEKEVSE